MKFRDQSDLYLRLNRLPINFGCNNLFNLKFRDQSDLYLRLKRLLHPKLMGNLFKVALAYKCKNKNFNGFN